MSEAQKPYGKLIVTADPDDLARTAADRILVWATEAKAPARIALSGGSTPRRTYQELAGPRLLKKFPWQNVHWYWGDERFVPPDDPESNFRMVREAMLATAPIPAENIHPIPTVGLTADDAAAQYERLLRSTGADAAAGRALFDVCLLGLGDDGHTASLIPGEPALQERSHWVAVVAHGRPETRITLTYPAIDLSRHIAFLVSGTAKKAILADVTAGGSSAPAARVSPLGDVVFIADRAASGA